MARRIARAIVWATGCAVLVVLVAAIALVALVNNEGVHRRLIRKVEEAASAQLGVGVRLENFSLHPATLRVDLYGVSVDGAPPYARPELLRIDHVEIGARVVSVLAWKWHLSTVRVDHPVVWITIDANGASSLPTLKSSGNGNGTSVFDLAIRHAEVDRGEVYFNSRPSALAADVHDVDFHATFNSLLAKYRGRLAYTNAHLQYGAMRPLAHNLDVSFDATRSEFHLIEAKVSSGTSQVRLSGLLKDYGRPEVQAQYDATLDGGQLAQIFKEPSIPDGLIDTKGSLRYQQAAGRGLLQSLTANGALTGRRLNVKVKASSLRVEIDNLAAHYALANGDATVCDLRASVLGGVLTAQGTMKNVGDDSRTSVSAALRGVSLARLRQVFLHVGTQPGVAVHGALDATATASWGKTLDDLTAHVDAAANGQVFRPGGTQDATAVPVESVIHGTYNGTSKQLTVQNSYLRTAQTNVALNGVAGRRSSLAMKVQANDLREVAEMAELFRTAAPAESLRQLDLAGEASFEGQVQGTTAAPHLTGALSAANVHVNGTDWKAVQAQIDLSPSHAEVERAEIASASGGRIGLSASAGLDNWSFTDQNPVQVHLSASRMDVAELAKLAEQPIPVTGKLNASLLLHGSGANPQGNGHVSLAGVTVYDEPVRSASLSFSGDGNDVHADLSARLVGGEVVGKATIRPHAKTYAAQLTVSGIDLGKLHAVEARGMQVSGAVTLQASGQGSFDHPQMDASVEIPALAIGGQTISALKLDAHVADRVAHAELSSSVMGAALQGKAAVELSGDYLADAALDTKAFSLKPLLAAYAPDEAADVNGQAEVHATLHGPLKNRGQIEAHAMIPLLKLGYGNHIELAAAAPIQIDYKNGIVNLQPASIRGTDTDLKLQAVIPTSGDAPASLLAQGTVNLQLLQIFNPDLQSSGELRLNINSHGPLDSRNLGGEIDVVNVSFLSADLPVGLQHGNGVLTLSADRLNIDRLQGTVGGGTVTAQGGIVLRPQLQFNMGVAAQGVRLLYPQGMRENMDATLRLTGALNHAALGGTMNVSDLSFTPTFDLTAFIRQFSSGVQAPPQRGFAQNLALNIAVRSTNNVNLVSRTLSVGGTANLQVRGTAAQPVILGRVNLSGGDIIANGNRFVLTGGTVQFVNPSETEPVVNLMLTTSIQQYNINLRFNGPVEQLRTEYSSDPALPTADIINLLAFGQTTEASAQNPMTANQQAESLVASQVSSQVTSRVSKIAGISQLSISPVLAQSSSQGPPGANITIQQRVTSNLFVTFSANVASTQSQTIQGQYKVSPRVSLSATRDPNGGFAVDALIKKSW